MMRFRVGKHQMRNGLSATIHEETPDGELLGILSSKDGVRTPAIWNKQGEFQDAINWGCDYPESPEQYDLAPISHSVWLNIYKSDTGYVFDAYSERAAADMVAKSNRIACVPMVFDEGAGLEHLLPR